MKIFLDTANPEAIKKYASTGLIDGITTNPTHLSKEKNDPKKQVLAICKALPHGEISVEVTEKDPKAVYKQAHAIAKLADNILVKIPCYKDYYPVIHQLVEDGIKINITLVFTLMQGLFMSKLGVTYISPFVGRLDDIDIDGVQGLFELRSMVDTYHYQTGILAASLRHPRHVHEAINAGADVVTVSPALFEKIIEHPLTDAGMVQFDADWKKLGITKFP
jgi:transaldolase